MKKRFPYILTLLLPFLISTCHAQETQKSYNLVQGERFFLESSIKQRTESENQGFKGSVSLDISSLISMKVLRTNEHQNYIFECKYTDLELSFFSSGSTVSISSKSEAFNSIDSYLNKLEDQIFLVELSPLGETIEIWNLDSIINDFYNLNSYKAEEHDIFIKTVKEGFGEEALQGLLNIALNIYTETSDLPTKKHTDIYFNAKILSAQNSFYYQTDNNNNFRVQGIGIIQEDEETIELEGFTMKTIMRGDQTYDFVINPTNGWIINGVSKQNIQSMSILENYSDGPEGLKIPSFSKTEYQFKGGKIESDK